MLGMIWTRGNEIQGAHWIDTALGYCVVCLTMLSLGMSIDHAIGWLVSWFSA